MNGCVACGKKGKFRPDRYFLDPGKVMVYYILCVEHEGLILGYGDVFNEDGSRKALEQEESDDR